MNDKQIVNDWLELNGYINMGIFGNVPILIHRLPNGLIQSIKVSDVKILMNRIYRKNKLKKILNQS